MKIAHILTLWSDSGEYGGPKTVASNLAADSAQAGHEVVLIAGTRSRSPSLEEIDGYKLILFPVRTAIPWIGFAGISSPGLSAWAYRNRREFDVFHVHAARDLITMPTAKVLSKSDSRVVCQTHGMVDQSDNRLATPFDRIFTRTVFENSHAILALTELERRELIAVGAPSEKVQILPNGVSPRPPSAWPSLTTPPIVSFISRLQARKRPAIFAQAAAELISEGVDANFILAGPDEGEGALVRRVVDSVGDNERLTWMGPLKSRDVNELIQKSSLIVLPSVDEPYPMVVLESLACGRPVVVTDSCGLASLVEASDAGIVCGADLPSVKRAIADALSSRDRLPEMGNSGRLAVNRYNKQAMITSQLLTYYSNGRSQAKESGS